MVFEKLELKHVKQVEDSLYRYAPNKANDYTNTGLFMWRDYLNAYVAIEGDEVYIYQYVNGRYLFYFPLCSDAREGLKKILAFVKAEKVSYGFYPLCKEEIALLDELGISYTEDYSEDYRDYLYQKNDLMLFRGKKYHAQRNHLNRFLFYYPDYKYVAIDEENLPRVKDFFHDFCEKYPYRDVTEQEEYVKIPEMLDHMEEYRLFGYFMEIGGVMEGFELGEIVGNMYYSHVQKANTEIHGIYSAMVNQMMKELPESVEYINREEDMGNAGLRTSKQRYRPCGYIEKYMILCES